MAAASSGGWFVSVTNKSFNLYASRIVVYAEGDKMLTMWWRGVNFRERVINVFIKCHFRVQGNLVFRLYFLCKA